ncbi:fumarylacetoacetate hydrolase family protein [Actinoplanes sp. CA-054009]
MRIANLDGRAVVVTDAGAVDIAAVSSGAFPSDPQELYRHWPEFLGWAGSHDFTADKADTYAEDRLGAPAPRPGQLFAIGLNYRDHAAESGFTAPESPAVFTKFRSSITGPYTEVVLPAATVDWEAELVVVVGRTARDVPAERAWEHVAGLTVGQDLSERTLQRSGPAPQFSLAKSFPGFTPMGPWLVTVDELHAAGLSPGDLAIGCAVNDETMQDGTTADLIFSVPQLIASLSAVLTLEPGDVVFTGTPAGVGGARKPPRFLRPGDVLVSAISGLGEMRQRFVAA